MTVESLSKLITLPALPVDCGSVEGWQRIEESLSTALPNDYKKYINRFGSGSIGRFLWPFNPFSRNENLNLIEQVKIRLNALQVLKDRFSEKHPYPLYPEMGGLLPWGATDNGDVLFWLTDGKPDDWIVVINESRGPKFEKFEETTTSFLSKLITGDIVSNIIPNDFLDKDALFVPEKKAGHSRHSVGS